MLFYCLEKSMADMVTKQELANAKIDAKDLGDAVNEKKTVIPRYGSPFKTVPLVIEELNTKANEVIAQGFYKGFATEAALLAAKPTVSEMRARADDTRKIWRWNRTSAEGVTPVTGAWADTGLSDADIAVGAIGLKDLNSIQNPSKLTLDQVLFNTMPTSTTGTATVVVRNGIKQLRLVSAATGGSIIASWDFLPSDFSREFAASITVENLTAGKNGLVGIQHLDAGNNVLFANYALTEASAAITKRTFKMLSTGVFLNAKKIRLIVNMQTDAAREMYIHSPFIADGVNADFIPPKYSKNEDLLLSSFIKTIGVNQFNKALAEDSKIISYQTGALAAFANGISFGKQAVQAGGTYTFSISLLAAFYFKRIIYTYDKNGSFLGMDSSQGSGGEVVNPNPPKNLIYADGDKTVTFSIPDNSNIAFIQMMIVYAPHTTTDFNNLINGMQLEVGTKRTSYVAYDPYGQEHLYLKPSAIVEIPSSSGGLVAATTNNTFNIYIDGTYAYIRTAFDSTRDMVQLVQYGTSVKWSNNVVNPYQIKIIPKSTAKENLVNAYNAGTLVVSHSDDAAPLRYNGTYIGANHGAYIVHEVTVSSHSKTYADVGSKWSNGTLNYTLMRIVDTNKLWFVSDNTGTAAQWAYNTTSLASSNTLTHVSGAANTSSITATVSAITQLYPAVNNHTKNIIADGFRELSASGFYDVESVEFIDTYDVMNVPAIIAYAQSKVGTVTEMDFSLVNTIAADFCVQVGYRYALNGSITINTQLQKKSEVSFEFAGITQALPLNYSGKTLLQYVPKMNPVIVGGSSYDLSATIDVGLVTAVINMLKADWSDANNPPDRMAQVVKTGAVKDFGHVVGYSLNRGTTKPSIRKNTTDAGFFNGPTKKMYPKALVGSINSVSNIVAYRSLYNPNLLAQATVYTWYQDNKDIYVVLDIHQNASMLKLPLPAMFNGRSAIVIDANPNFTLHSEIVSDGGLLCSIINSYATATIKLS